MDWPDGLEAGSIREWPGSLRAPANRQYAKFKRPGRFVNGKWVGQTPMPLSQTVEDLGRELRALRAKDAELLVAYADGGRASDARRERMKRAVADSYALALECVADLGNRFALHRGRL